jgi:transposase
MTKEDLEGYLAEGLSLEEIGKRVGRHPSTVSYHLKKHGLLPLGHELHSPKRKVDPAELRDLIEAGRTFREIAEVFGVSYTTVRHWVKKLGLESGWMRRLRESREAISREETRVLLVCGKHGETVHFRRADGNYRCARCRTEAVTCWRRRVKRRLVAEAGGACTLCGYDRYAGALHFHHLDPAQKSFLLSRNGVTRSFAEARAEAAKCILLCGNCHAEVEAGVVKLPGG